MAIGKLFGADKSAKISIDDERIVMPKHIGVIMDGNGRWAKSRGLPRSVGHAQGAKNFRKIALYAKSLGVENITFYAFSTENWRRPEDEVNALMDIFDENLDDFDEFIKEKVRMQFVGDISKFRPSIVQKMHRLEDASRDFDKMTLGLAVNYGGRDELVHAMKTIAQDIESGRLIKEQITEEEIDKRLYTYPCPDVDLIIRPSGELRLSNFLIWQSAYAEYYFTNINWPDFSKKDLDDAIIEFNRRNRRFGGV